MNQETFTKEQFWSELDALAEETVRIRLHVEKVYGTHSPKRDLAILWLEKQEQARKEVTASKRDRREEETLAIAREALASAREANRITSEDLEAARKNARWAMWAAIISVVAALITVQEKIIALTFGQP